MVSTSLVVRPFNAHQTSWKNTGPKGFAGGANRKSVANILLKVRNIIQHNRSASSYVLIEKLRPGILGWANYYRFCECSEFFGKVSIYQKLRAWVFRRGTRIGRRKLKLKYFPEGKSYIFDGIEHKDNWVLVGKELDKKRSAAKGKVVHRENFLPKVAWVHSLSFQKVRGNASVYNGDHLYWHNRSKNFGTLNATQRIYCYKRESAL